MREELLTDLYDQKVATFLDEEFKQKMVHGFQEMELRLLYRLCMSSSAALLILGGRTEFAEKYAELIYDLRHLNMSIYSYDHRGQGLSGRMLTDRQKGHVGKFEHYVEDLDSVLRKVILPVHKRVYILAHSMGGAVAPMFQLKYPGHVHGMILSSPMLGINCFPLPQFLTRWMGCGALFLGQGKKYIPGGGPYRKISNFHNNVLTSSRNRFDLNEELIDRTTGVALGSPTYRWLYESLAAAGEIAQRADEITIPVLLLQSGSDKVVTAAAQIKFARKASSCRLKTIDNARHELLMERDELRNQALAAIHDFLIDQGETLAAESN